MRITKYQQKLQVATQTEKKRDAYVPTEKTIFVRRVE